MSVSEKKSMNSLWKIFLFDKIVIFVNIKIFEELFIGHCIQKHSKKTFVSTNTEAKKNVWSKYGDDYLEKTDLNFYSSSLFEYNAQVL